MSQGKIVHLPLSSLSMKALQNQQDYESYVEKLRLDSLCLSAINTVFFYEQLASVSLVLAYPWKGSYARSHDTIDHRKSISNLELRMGILELGLT